LFIGSEGTLGIVTEATLRLACVPPTVAVAVSSFPTIRAASDAVIATMQAGVQVSTWHICQRPQPCNVVNERHCLPACLQVGAVELMDAPMVDVVNSQSGFAYPLQPLVFYKLSGSPAKVADDAAVVQVGFSLTLRRSLSS
jgi:D-lactate dehydrogenase (cytochrome)